MVLEAENKYFQRRRSEFLDEHEGKYALIKGEECFGFYDDLRAAYKAGVQQFGIEAFLIKEVSREEQLHELPAHYLGLLNAPV